MPTRKCDSGEEQPFDLHGIQIPFPQQTLHVEGLKCLAAMRRPE